MPANDKLILRLLWVPFGAVFLYSLIFVATNSLSDILLRLSEDGFEVYAALRTGQWIALVVFAALVISHLSFEIAAHVSTRLAYSRILTHLRWGPVAVTCLWIGVVVAFDAAMIEVSRWKIRNYVYSGSAKVEKPELGVLHINYRGWCGNGASAAYEDLYYPTASSGLGDSDPAVRARSFLASEEVSDFFNGSYRFRADTATACEDESKLVRRTVEEYLAGRKSSCEAARSAVAR